MARRPDRGDRSLTPDGRRRKWLTWLFACSLTVLVLSVGLLVVRPAGGAGDQDDPTTTPTDDRPDETDGEVTGLGGPSVAGDTTESAAPAATGAGSGVLDALGAAGSLGSVGGLVVSGLGLARERRRSRSAPTDPPPPAKDEDHPDWRNDRAYL